MKHVYSSPVTVKHFGKNLDGSVLLVFFFFFASSKTLVYVLRLILKIKLRAEQGK